MLVLRIYIAGWFLTAVYLLCKMKVPNVEAPRFLLYCALFLAAAAGSSIWPALLLIRIGFECWHHLGHPGMRKR